MKDLVSIIMTTCNRKYFTQQAILSVLKNTHYQPYQFILVDNGSRDGTRAFIQELESTYPLISYLFSSKNLGRGQGANLGLQLAEGEYLVILDDDLLVPQGWLTKMVNALKAIPQVGWLSTNLRGEEDPDYHLKELLQSDPRYIRTFNGIHIETPPGVGGWCMAMPRNVYERLGDLQQDRYYGGIDKEYYQQAINEGLLVGYVQDVVAEHLGGTKKEMEHYPRYREYKIQVHHQRWFQGKNTLAQKDFFAQRREDEEAPPSFPEIREGSLMKDQEENFFVIHHHKRCPPPPLPKELKLLFFKEATVLPPQFIEEIPLGKPQKRKLLRSKEGKTVYLILGKKRHPISSLSAFHNYGFKAQEIVLVEESLLSSYEEGFRI